MEQLFKESVNCKMLARCELANVTLQKNAYEQGTLSPTHAHENARFVFVLRGKFSELYGSKIRECGPFMAIFRPPQEEHSEDYYGKGIVSLSIDAQPVWIERLRQYNVNLNNSVDFRSNNLVSLMTRLNDEIVNRDNVSALAIDSLLLEIAVEIYRQEKRVAAKDKKPRWLGDVKDYINTRLTSNLTISEIAAAVKVHPVHLARVFRQNYGCTIADHIRQLRVEFACNRLSSSDESLAEIALSSGFSDQSHFSKTFKRITNLTPHEYRTAINSR